jgi:hypothetical protein
MRYNLPDDDELDDFSQHKFHENIKQATKIELSNINGGENHLNRIK